jgi:hypothetical protein
VTALLAAAAGMLVTACGGLALRPGHPWIEDLSLTLAREVLVLEVLDDRVAVDARFSFEAHGETMDRVMFFPVALPGGEVAGFGALLSGPGAEPLPLPVRPGLPGALPAGQTSQSFDIMVPGEALELHGGELVVRYEQQASCGFGYILRSGAYWRGPIGSLTVLVRDEASRVTSASVEEEPPHRREGGTAAWSWEGLEPRSGVTLLLECP